MMSNVWGDILFFASKELVRGHVMQNRDTMADMLVEDGTGVEHPAKHRKLADDTCQTRIGGCYRL